MPRNETDIAAAKVRCQALAAVHVEKAAKLLLASSSCLKLTRKETAIVRDQIAVLLLEIFEGKTTLEPNPFQRAAAECGREEVTEADMLMFAAKLQIAERMVGRQLTFQEQGKVIQHVMQTQAAIDKGKPEPVLTLIESKDNKTKNHTVPKRDYVDAEFFEKE